MKNKITLFLLIVFIGLSAFLFLRPSQEADIEVFLGEFIQDEGSKLVFKLEDDRQLILDSDKNPSLGEAKTYILAKDQDNRLVDYKLIEENIHNEEEPDIDEESSYIIEPSEKFDIEAKGYQLVDKSDYSNGFYDIQVSNYVKAEKSNGVLSLDDGQDWLLTLEVDGDFYLLFDDYIQLGDLKFYNYTIDGEDFHTYLLYTGTANINVIDFLLDRENRQIKASEIFSTDGNVNVIHIP